MMLSPVAGQHLGGLALVVHPPPYVLRRLLYLERHLVAAAAGRGLGRPGGVPRVRSHCRFRNRGTTYLSEPGMK
jgi:hypothetical protein